MNQNSAEKEGKTIFEVMQKDSNKKRKMVHLLFFPQMFKMIFLGGRSHKSPEKN